VPQVCPWLADSPEDERFDSISVIAETSPQRNPEGVMMSNTISANQLPASAPASANAAPLKKGTPDGPKLQTPEKAKLSMDPKEMQRNLQEAIDRLNDQMKQNGRDLRFSMDNVVDRPIITVKNSETGKVVRVIPNEVVIKIAHNIENFKGLLHNELI
jgi:flagellar protein FlaG